MTTRSANHPSETRSILRRAAEALGLIVRPVRPSAGPAGPTEAPARAAAATRATPAPAPRREAEPPAPARVTDEDVRYHAYMLSTRREGAEADPVGDWLRAERELRAGRPVARA